MDARVEIAGRKIYSVDAPVVTFVSPDHVVAIYSHTLLMVESEIIMMNPPIVITSDDPILSSLNFKPFRNKVERRVIPFLPGPGDPQTLDVKTPWGAVLTAKKGDFLVSEMDSPHDYWPVDPVIFEESYLITRPGYCAKNAITMLVPLTDITEGDPNQEVTVIALEGPETVRAGDFFLAKGIKGEVWPYPKEKIDEVMTPAE